MEEDTEYMKLPLEDRCVHKLWKARVHGYEECIKHFAQITDEKSPELNKFAPLMKKFVTDSNVVAQEKALDAVLIYVENAHAAGRTASEVTAGIVAKCLGAPKKGTQDKGIDIVLMYCEIEKCDAVIEELVKGLSQKNPKVQANCVRALSTALREFGVKAINLKVLIKQIVTILEDRDKNVREEGKKLVVEIYRWIGVALKPQLNALKPLQLQELETEFEKLGTAKAVQIRFLRSQQDLRVRMEAADGEEEEEGDNDEADAAPEVDTFDFLDPVDILAKLPKDFYEKLESKKWQERKEVLDVLLPLSQSPKLEVGDYHDLMKALKKVVGKDSNVVLVALAGQCVAGMAKGLKKKFLPFATSLTETILEKFKEKKVNVVNAMREAVDAIYQTSSLESLYETIAAALINKNPSVKAETASFVARCICYCTPTILNKKLLKSFITDLLKTLNESDPSVRDAAADALGAIMKVVGEKAALPFIGDVDSLKMQKIKEACEKTEMKVKVVAQKMAKKEQPVKSVPAVKAVTRPAATVAPKKLVATASAGAKGKKPGAKSVPVEECQEAELSVEECQEKVEGLLSADTLSGLVDANWKTRLSAIENFNSTVQSMSREEIPTQAFVKTLALKPGFKDNNFQVLKLKLEALKILAEGSQFTRRSAEVCLQDLVEKLPDPKNGQLAAEVLTAISESAMLQWVGPEVMNLAVQQKNPKVQELALKWLSEAILEFGLVVQTKAVIGDVKKGLSHSNPGVRTAAIGLCGTMFLYLGGVLRTSLEDEKAAVLQQVDAEFDKLKGQTPPKPKRGLTQAAAEVDDDDLPSGGGAKQGGGSGRGIPPPSIEDLIPRTDIEEKITEALLAELADKNWKTRSDALDKVSSILNEAKFVTERLGELPTALAARIADSNRNLAAEAMRVAGTLGEALGSSLCRYHVRAILPSVLAAIGDSKANIRQQAIATLNIWTENVGLKETMDGEMFADAFKSSSAFLKSELFTWMGEKLNDANGINKEELIACLPHLFSALEDRNVEIRRGGGEAVLPFMIHLGFEMMAKHVGKLKPASKTAIMPILEKARPNLPARTTVSVAAGKPKSAPAGGSRVTEKPGVGKSSSAGKRGGRTPSATRQGTAGSSRKEAEDSADSSPLLQVNGLKQQRGVDEQRLRVLKWDFVTPRAELINQLKEQMAAAGVNQRLVVNMFHADFKFHLKALDELSNDLSTNLAGCTANLDLILKWLSVRFFDTNPTVIMRAMDYLQAVFQVLSDDDYHLTDFEAASFLPYLVMKFGEPKDSIRGPARMIVRQLCSIYSAGKLSPYMLDGLKAKNARQRAECLEALEQLIESVGMSVCQPNPPTALKEVAKQIADRDNSVRNAALNVLVQVYLREGDKMYKLIGNISEKEMCLLEERIRRAAKSRPPPPKVIADPLPKVGAGPGAKANLGGGTRNLLKPMPAQSYPQVVAGQPGEQNGLPSRFADSRLRPTSAATNSNIFRIDYGLFERLLEDTVPSEERMQYKLEEIPDMHSILNFKPALPATRIARPGNIFSAKANPCSDIENSTSQTINLVISQVGNPDTSIVITALAQLDELMQSPERCQQLVPHIDQLLITATVQYRLVFSTKMAIQDGHGDTDCVRIYRSLSNCVLTIFTNPLLAPHATGNVMKDLLHTLISIILDPQLNALEEGSQIVRAINVLVVRVIDKGHFSHVTSAILRLLHDSVGCGMSAKYCDLVLKCNWKVCRILPNKVDQLDLDVVVMDLHNFLVAYPVSSWTSRPSDTPIRTIKTLIHSLCKARGSSLLSHVAKIDNANHAELFKYISKVLKSQPKTEEATFLLDSNHGVPHGGGSGANIMGDIQSSCNQEGKSTKRLTKVAHSALSEIFQKIGSKENTQEGLLLLYEFKQKQPDADIEPYLQKSSQFFQNYIERGLKRIERERQLDGRLAPGEGSGNAAPLSAIQVSSSAEPSFNINEIVDQFKNVAAQAGFDNEYIHSAVQDIISQEKQHDLTMVGADQRCADVTNVAHKD